MKMIRKKQRLTVVAVFIALVGWQMVHAQDTVGVVISITDTTPDPSAILDVMSTTKGMLIPRMTTTERGAVSSPADGLMVYDTDESAVYFYNGTTTEWAKVAGELWEQSGGDIYYTGGNFGLGTETPLYRLSLAGTSSIADRTIGINDTPMVYLAPQGTSQLIGSVAFGNGLRNLTSGSGKYNTGIGIGSLFSTTSGANNSALGNNALYSNTSGIQNTGIGSGSLYTNTTGGQNTAVGYQALYSNTTGSNNTAMGYTALYANTTGSYNTSFGITSLNANTTGGSNTCLGAFAMRNNTTGGSNTGVGTSALYTNTTGVNNTAVGSQALKFNTTGGQNTAIGVDALLNNTTGSYNVAIGAYALNTNTTGGLNMAVGPQALYSNTSGTSNFANGTQALYSNTSGNYNSAEGSYVLYTNTTGSNNTGNGYQSLKNSTTAGSNTGIGFQAGHDITTGSYNTILGNFPSTSSSITTGSNNILIGNDVRNGLSVTSSNQLNIGNLIYGTGLGSAGSVHNIPRVGINTATPDTTFSVNGRASMQGGGSWLTFSDRRVKKDTASFTDGIETIRQVHPMKYKYRGIYADTTTEFVGVIAQDMQSVAPYTVKSHKIEVRGRDANMFQEKTYIRTDNIYVRTDTLVGPNDSIILQPVHRQEQVYEVDALSYDQSALFYVMINALKQLDAENAELRSRIEVLENE